jgi:signal peptidase II
MSNKESSVIAFAGLTAIVVIALDQMTKVLARNAVSGSGSNELLGGLITIVDVRNSGVAFGQLSGGGIIVPIFVGLALALLLWYFLRHLQTPLIWLATGLVVGGAVGNIIDRIRAGAVSDFIKLPHWPAFNFADAAITVGVIALVVLVEIDSRRQRRSGTADAN